MSFLQSSRSSTRRCGIAPAFLAARQSSSSGSPVLALVAAVAFVFTLAATPADAAAKKKAVATSKRPAKTEASLAGGTHWRISSKRGAIHVWIPPGYNRENAGTVVYVHGYYTDADRAWKDHKLASQFKASRQNAMFIVPEAPSGNDEAVVWPSLTDLKAEVGRANIRLPDGPIIVLAHSGAFRTVSSWVDNKLLGEVVLLDALYGGNAAFDEFIHGGKRAEHHKLILIAADTATKSKDFAKKYRYAAVRDSFPSGYDGFTKNERRSKLLYIRSQFGHSSIIESGKVIPIVLRLTPLALL